MSTELLAQLIEITSVVAAEQRIQEPVRITRPSWIANAAAEDAATDNETGVRNPFTAAIHRLMATPPPAVVAA